MSIAIAQSAVTPPDPSGSRIPARRRPAYRGKLLWVDDDPNVTAAMTRRFRRKGYEVWPASDGMQGYWTAVTRKPDLVVTDLRMPRWEGRDLLECLLANQVTASTPIVVVSGYLTPYERRRLDRIGVAASFEKPAEWPELLRVVRALTRRQSSGV